MLFRILRIGKTIRDAKRDPSGFVGEQSVDILRGVFLIWKVIFLVVFFVLGVFSFSSFLGGPYTGVKILFFFWFFLLVVAFFIMRRIVRFTKRKTERVASTVVKDFREHI